MSYPIKYALQKIRINCEKTRFRDAAIGFIAAKCYVLNSKATYYESQDSSTFYRVFFPYYRIIRNPRTCNIDAMPTNEMLKDNYDRPLGNATVSQLFDTLEDAKKLASQKNEEIRTQRIIRLDSHIGISDDIINRNLLEDFDENLEFLEKLEKTIELKTADMTITKDKEKCKVKN